LFAGYGIIVSLVHRWENVVVGFAVRIYFFDLGCGEVGEAKTSECGVFGV